MPYSVIIVEDHTLLREAWAELINTQTCYQVFATYSSAEEVLMHHEQIKADIAILDINLPGMNGLDATTQLRMSFPGIKIIGISIHCQPAFVKKMMSNGALGYVTKSSPANELFKALDEVVKGNRYICTEVKNIIAEQSLSGQGDPASTLSKREVEIIRLLKEGKSSKEIASDLYISTKTVEVHRYNILHKLNLKNVAALVQYVNDHPTLFA